MIFIANVLKSTYSHILTLGVVYFQCADKHGIFAPPHRVRLLIEVSKPLQHVRGEAAMRDRDACVARRRRASIPVYKVLCKQAVALRGRCSEKLLSVDLLTNTAYCYTAIQSSFCLVFIILQLFSLFPKTAINITATANPLANLQKALLCRLPRAFWLQFITTFEESLDRLQ